MQDVLIVFEKDPNDCDKAVEDGGKEMLIPMNPFSPGFDTETQERHGFEVAISADDVGVGMMEQVMSDFPGIGRSADELEGIARQTVYPPTRCISAMRGVMRNIKANARQK